MMTGKNGRTGVVHEHKEQNWLITISLVILAVVALACALIYTRGVMIPFVVALFIVALVLPIEDFQVRRLRIPRVIAIIVTLLVVLSVIVLASLFVAQAIRTIAYTAGDYSVGFVNMANKLLKPLEYVYKLPESPPLVVPETPKPPLAATPNDVGPIESKPETVELFPVVKDADKPGILDVRPRPSPPMLSKAKGLDNSVLLNVGPQPAPPASTEGVDKAAAPKAVPQASRPRSEGETSSTRAVAKDSNAVADANTAANGPTKSQWHIDTRQIVEDLIANARQVIRDMANHMFNMLRNTVGTIFGLLSGVLFVCIFVIFLLAGHNPYAEHSQVYTDVVRKIRRYLGTKVITSALVGVLVWASLAIIGLELAGVFGVLAFLVNFIPAIGPIIVTLLPIPLAVAQFQSPWPVVLVVVIPGTIHNIIGNIIEPKLMGEGLDLHPVTILLALSFWGLLWGIVGMFLATPITAAIRIVLMQFDTFKPIANLLAGDFSKPPIAAGTEATAASARPAEIVPDGSLPG
ncbi:MAG: AI-2E family transporter [Phycisphaerae bacterium]|nr:AI-2E family transporter [Phycisphaerae bacterium]